MSRDIAATKAELERCNAELEQRIAALDREAREALRGAPIQYSSLLDSTADAASVCTEAELEVLRRIADSVAVRDVAGLDEVRAELEQALRAARASEDVYVELCRDLLDEATRIQALCTAHTSADAAQTSDER